ncbi:MAG: oxidoreductase [Cyclobacteriaceae bacterium]|nr:MAG: oxidoreductase [Cyclobacteriaceae bacterium]
MKTRRSTLKTLAALTAGLLVPAKGISGDFYPPNDRFGELLPLRLLGKTGEKVTMLGIGGAHIAHCDEKTAEAQIECAIDGGVRFFDNAHSYGSGLAEERYGKFLVPKYRDVSFIMTKSTATSGKKALAELEQSLSRMKLDYVDLWQIHSIRSPGDVDARIEQEVLEVFRKAKESGKTRYIGFTGHTDFNAHKHMLKRTNILETCQMPINCFDPNYKSFINNVMPSLVEMEIGIIAMKTLSNGGFFGGTTHFEGGKNPRIVPGVATVQEAIHFVWSLPVSTLVTGANDVPMLQEKIDLAKSFKKMNEQSRMELVERVGKADLDGAKVEFYKA